MEFSQKSATFQQREFETPDLRAGEVLVRVTCCTICGSDLHTFTGRRKGPASCVLGHEIIGEVEGWASHVAPIDFHGHPIQRGDRVTWAMAVGCGHCFYCQHDLSQKCTSLFKYGHEFGPNSRCSGPAGGLSTNCVLVPGTSIFQLPKSLSDEEACPANCATATVSAAMRLIKQTHRLKGSVALVVGSGMLGLNAIARLDDTGAEQIIVIEPSQERRDLAREFGATACLSLDEKDEVKKLTKGRGADIVLDFAGVSEAVHLCLDAARMGGCVLLAGSVFPGEEIRLSPELLVRHVLTIRGLHNYLPDDLDDAIQFLRRTQQRYPFHRLVERTFSLQDAANAFEYARTTKPVRVAIKPNQAR